MEEGFRNRAHHVDELLGDTATRFVLVASPRRDTLEEAVFFADALNHADIQISALIVNRMHPRFAPSLAEAARERAESLAGTAIGDHYANLADFQLIASREEEHLDALVGKVGDATVVATAHEGERTARAEATVQVVESRERDASRAGIPEPAFVSEPMADWRSRMRDGRWEGEPYAPGGASRPRAGVAGDLLLRGDLDGDGRDEIGYVVDNADWSNTNTYVVVSYRNDAWTELFRFAIWEWQLPDLPDAEREYGLIGQTGRHVHEFDGSMSTVDLVLPVRPGLVKVLGNIGDATLDTMELTFPPASVNGRNS